MADKKSVITTPKGPPMLQVMHGDQKVWANRTKDGQYRCIICKAVSHDKVKQ